MVLDPFVNISYKSTLDILYLLCAYLVLLLSHFLANLSTMLEASWMQPTIPQPELAL